jgi:hypothetical protein
MKLFCVALQRRAACCRAGFRGIVTTPPAGIETPSYRHARPPPHPGPQAALGARVGARDQARRLDDRLPGRQGRAAVRRGHDWTDRCPSIAAAATKLRAKSFTLDGEAVVSGPDGVAVFDALHRRRRATDAMLYAFDLLELNGKDLRPMPLVDRKAKLERLLTRAPPCKLGLEASCRSGSARPIGRARHGAGSRRGTRIARRCGGRGRGCGDTANRGPASS